MEVCSTAALDRRLSAIEDRLGAVHSEAAGANAAAKSAQQRLTAAEWRIEKVSKATMQSHSIPHPQVSLFCEWVGSFPLVLQLETIFVAVHA